MDTPDDEEKSKALEQSESDESILEIARRRFALCEEADAEIKREALDDLRFIAGEQWPQELKNARGRDGRPCLTVNRLPQFVRQVENDARQNRPSIKVNPVDDHADIETAKVFQDLIRNIEYSSNADVAYDTAFGGAARGGFGFFRVVTEYVSPESFDQEPRIVAIPNQFSVSLDPDYQAPDGSDSNFGFIFSNVSKDAYQAQYPDSDLCSLSDWESQGDSMPGWMGKEHCRIAEYFYKEFKNVTLCLLSDGSTIDKADLEGQQLPEGLTVVDERKTVRPQVKWCKINGLEILEKTDWPGQWVPIIPVLGTVLYIDGVKKLEGLIRHAKDPQRMLNFWVSAETETIALAPRAPFIGAAGQFKGFENSWKVANKQNVPYLEYNEKTLNNIPVGPPQRNAFEPATQAITNARMQTSEDLKATTGIYDAGLGNRSNENSGVAIQRRNQQSQTANFHFVDNLSRSIRHLGRILIDIIPKVYDTARVLRTLGEDGQPTMVAVNKIFEQGGDKKIHNLSLGKYDCTVSTGPSYSTKRQEAAAAMIDFTKAMPAQAAIIADLMVKNFDFPGADVMAERLKKTLPPGIAEPDDKDKKPIPPETQAQMQQMGQMIEQLTQHVNELSEEAKTKKMELESKERIANAQIQAQIEIELAKMGSKESQALLVHQISEIQHRLDLLHANQPIDDGNEPVAPTLAPQGMNQPTGGASPGLPMETP